LKKKREGSFANEIKTVFGLREIGDRRRSRLGKEPKGDDVTWGGDVGIGSKVRNGGNI